VISKGSFLRLFVAIAVPEAARMEMRRLQDELRGLASPDDVRWVHPRQFHLTLKFLGAVPPASLEAVKAALTSACDGIAPFRVYARGIGFFPHDRSPRVIWVGLDSDHAGLIELRRRVDRALASFAEKHGEETFRAHVTIGRFQKFRRHKAEKLLPRASAFRDHVFGEWQVDAVALMRSELSSDGARHTALISVPLG